MLLLIARYLFNHVSLSLFFLILLQSFTYFSDFHFARCPSLLAITFRNGNIGGPIENISRYLLRSRSARSYSPHFRSRLDRRPRRRDSRTSSLLYLLTRRIRHDPREKDRDLRSARCSGEIPRDNSELRSASFPSLRSARAEKDGQNQGIGFLGKGSISLRNSIPAIIALWRKPGRAQPGDDLSASFAGEATVNNHDQTDDEKGEEDDGRPGPNRGLFLGNLVVVCAIGRRIKGARTVVRRVRIVRGAT